jgi:glycosyltransferase involved in cell wall biosynthesis
MTGAGFVDGILRAGSRTWRRIAPSSARSLATPIMGAIARRRVLTAAAHSPRRLQRGPLVVSGFLSESRGVSEGGRLTIAGLRSAGLDPVAHDLRSLLDGGPGRNEILPGGGQGGVWMLHANAPEAVHAMSYLDPSAWRDRYRIGYWVYELPRAPDLWARLASAFDEIWTPSRFACDALANAGIRIPLRVMPHPVAVAEHVAAPDRRAFGLPDGDFIVLVMADFRSSAARKNVLGAVEIYKRAFPDVARNTRLVIKAQAIDPFPSLLEAFQSATRGRPDIVWMKESLSSEDARALIASSDVLLSPHRAEGFGLPLAEAFMSGIPALATGWSGNLDFMGDVPELLIRHSLVPVHDPSGIYRARTQQWAEPDIADAAAKLKALAESPSLRGELAARGRKAVESLSSAWSPAALAHTGLGQWTT